MDVIGIKKLDDLLVDTYGEHWKEGWRRVMMITHVKFLQKLNAEFLSDVRYNEFRLAESTLDVWNLIVKSQGQKFEGVSMSTAPEMEEDDRLCRICGQPARDHHDFTPMPEGCACPPEDWSYQA